MGMNDIWLIIIKSRVTPLQTLSSLRLEFIVCRLAKKIIHSWVLPYVLGLVRRSSCRQKLFFWTEIFEIYSKNELLKELKLVNFVLEISQKISSIGCYSTLSRFVHVVMYCLRFVHNSRIPKTKYDASNSSRQNHLIRSICLASGRKNRPFKKINKQVSMKNTIFRLLLFLDNNHSSR